MRKLIVILSLSLSQCGSGNLEYVKEHAPAKWEKQGFKVVDYEGYQWGSWVPFTTYGGACVWHRLKKLKDNGISYTGCIKRWGDELHVYGPIAIDAIKP